jgi:hypothetical protein
MSLQNMKSLLGEFCRFLVEISIPKTNYGTLNFTVISFS